MAIIKTNFPGLMIIEPTVFRDSRGYFFESYNKKKYSEQGIDIHFVQDNQSKSSYGVIRGLHYQMAPFAQSKLIRVLSGEILDVVLDLRQGSPSFGKVFTLRISAENNTQLLIPKGFAHGFSVLSETAEVIYKCDEFYNKESESGIMFNDPALNIDWLIPTDKAIISEKDLIHPDFKNCKNNFVFES